MDSYAAKILGYEHSDIKYIKMAKDEGIGSLFDDDTDIVYI